MTGKVCRKATRNARRREGKFLVILGDFLLVEIKENMTKTLDDVDF